MNPVVHLVWMIFVALSIFALWHKVKRLEKMSGFDKPPNCCRFHADSVDSTDGERPCSEEEPVPLPRKRPIDTRALLVVVAVSLLALVVVLSLRGGRL